MGPPPSPLLLLLRPPPPLPLVLSSSPPPLSSSLLNFLPTLFPYLPLTSSSLLSFLPMLLPYLPLSLSAYNMPSFRAGAQLLSSLSGYAYTKRAWKKEVLDLYMDPLFFHMDPSCACQWVAHPSLITHTPT